MKLQETKTVSSCSKEVSWRLRWRENVPTLPCIVSRNIFCNDMNVMQERRIQFQRYFWSLLNDVSEIDDDLENNRYTRYNDNIVVSVCTKAHRK